MTIANPHSALPKPDSPYARDGYFNGPERVSRLIYHAQLWMGTPWCANSDARGRGVSCHNLPRAVYIEAGALSPEFPRVQGDPNGTKHKKESIIEPWIDSRPELFRLPYDARPKPGDLLGLRIYHCLDHLGVCLAGVWFVHVLMHKHVDCDDLSVPPWRQRILGIWRVKPS